MKKFLRKIYAYKFFEDFVLIYPLYAVMFTDLGMEPWQLGTLLAVWSVTTFLLEIPSGAWADRYSRRKILFIGQLIRSLGYLCWLIFPNFWGFLVGFIFWGIESALSSGTFEALLYDELKHFGKAGDFTKILGRCRSIALVALMMASFLASPAILLDYPIVLLLSSGAVFMAGLSILSIPEAQVVESAQEEHYFRTLKEGVGAAFQNQGLLYLILFLSLATALPGALDEYWTIFADQATLPKYGLGLFIGILGGVEAVANLVAYRFEHRSYRFFYVTFLFNGLILLLAAYLFSIPALVLLLLFSFSFAIVQTVWEGKIQEAIPAKTRATVSSVRGFLTEIFVILVYFSFGLIAQQDNYQLSFLSFGLLISGIGIFYLIFGRRR